MTSHQLPTAKPVDKPAGNWESWEDYKQADRQVSDCCRPDMNTARLGEGGVASAGGGGGHRSHPVLHQPCCSPQLTFAIFFLLLQSMTAEVVEYKVAKKTDSGEGGWVEGS